MHGKWLFFHDENFLKWPNHLILNTKSCQMHLNALTCCSCMHFNNKKLQKSHCECKSNFSAPCTLKSLFWPTLKTWFTISVCIYIYLHSHALWCKKLWDLSCDCEFNFQHLVHENHFFGQHWQLGLPSLVAFTSSYAHMHFDTKNSEI